MVNSKISEFSHKVTDDTKAIYKYLGVPVLEYSNSKSEEFLNILQIPLSKYHFGFTICLDPQAINDEKTLVFYNDAASERHQAMTLLHELGHILMEDWVKPDKTKIGEMEKGEFFAEMFACVMAALSIKDIQLEQSIYA